MHQQLIDKDRLLAKISTINPSTLISTTTARVRTMMTDPKVTTTPELESFLLFLDHLESNKDSITIGDLTDHNHNLLINVLKHLATTIIVQHLLELTDIEDPATQSQTDSDLNGIPKEIGKTIRISGGGLDAGIRISNGPDHSITFDICDKLFMLDSLFEVVYYIGRSDVGCYDTLCAITYIKLILDLLVLDDHSPEAIDAYAESQHDWCLSSSFISGMSHKINSLRLSSNDRRLHYDENDEFLAKLVVTALIHDCRALSLDSDSSPNHCDLVSTNPNPEPSITMIDRLLGNYDNLRTGFSGLLFSADVLHWDTTCDFIKEIEVSSYALYSDGDGCYDAEAMEMSELRCALNTQCGLHEIQPYRKILENRDELGESTIIDHYLQANDRAGVSIYDDLVGINDYIRHRTYCNKKWYNRVDFMLRDYDAGPISYKPDVPVDMRSRVTREMLIGLESETHFIRRALLCDAIGNNNSVIMEKILGEDEFIDPEFLADFIANGFLGFGRHSIFTQYFHSRQAACFGVPSSMLDHPGDVSDMLTMSSILDFGCTAISRKTDGLDTCYEIADYGDESKERSEPEARYLAFMKMYFPHLMVRFPDTITSGRRVTPFEQFVMDDVLRSVMAAYESDVLSLDGDSDWYGSFADACLDVLIDFPDCDLDLLSCEPDGDDGGEGVMTNNDDLMMHHSNLVDPRGGSPLDNRQPECVKMDSMLAHHVKGLYRRMLDGGDLHWMDEVFGRLDGVLVDAIVDHYLARLDVGSDSSLPDGYILENLRMDVDNNYGKVGSLIHSE